MAKYVLRGRYRRKQYKRSLSKRRVYVKRAYVNPGIAIRNDNMVWMKRLHRGKAKMKYNYGNPSSNYLSGFLRGTKNTSYKDEAKYKSAKKQKNLRGSFKSEM